MSAHLLPNLRAALAPCLARSRTECPRRSIFDRQQLFQPLLFSVRFAISTDPHGRRTKLCRVLSASKHVKLPRHSCLPGVAQARATDGCSRLRRKWLQGIKNAPVTIKVAQTPEPHFKLRKLGRRRRMRNARFDDKQSRVKTKPRLAAGQGLNGPSSASAGQRFIGLCKVGRGFTRR
jgi:hypothetical protein